MMFKNRHKQIKIFVLAMACAPSCFAQQAPAVALPSLPVLPAAGSASTGASAPVAPLPAAPTAPLTPTSPVAGAAAPAAPAPANGATGTVAQGDLPLLPGAKPAATSAAAPTPVAASAVPEKQYSYGKSSLSILFPPEQILKMKEALRAFEDGRPDVVKPTLDLSPVAQEPVIQEPDNYPVFNLASIVFHGPSDWSLWLAGHKITSKRNNTDVQVVSVSSQEATFAWKPSYGDAIRQRKASNMFAPTDTVKNKMAVAQNIHYDSDTGLITFTLKQNQSFSVAYFSVFEGFVASVPLPSLTPTADGQIPVAATADASSQPAPVLARAPQPPPGAAGTSGFKKQMEALKEVDGIAKELSSGTPPAATQPAKK